MKKVTYHCVIFLFMTILLSIKISEKNFKTQRFNDSMSSFSSGKRIKLGNLIYTVRGDFIRFPLENDDMESSKCCVLKFFSLIFIIRCLSKSNLILLS